MQKLNFGRYDYAAFMTFAVYAASSLAVPVVLVDMAKDLHFPLAEGGMHIGGGMQMIRSVAMCLSMAYAGFAAAKWGNRLTIGVALCFMSFGILLCSLAPTYLFVMPMLLVAGIGEGVIEGLGTPFVQDMHGNDPGRYVNFTHGFWSLGTFGTAIAAGAMLVCGVSWRVVLAVVALLALPPILLILMPSKTSRYPEKAIGKSSREVLRDAGKIVKTPRFWFYFAAMLFAGGGEYCLTFWSASFLQLNFATSALVGAIGVAAFSAGMFLGRTSFGALVPQRCLKTLIVAAGVFAMAVSVLIPPFAMHIGLFPKWSVLPMTFLLLFLSGLGTAPFWPSIQSLCVDRLPGLDSTMAFIILSCAGVPGCGIFTWVMGVAGDVVGLARSFYLVPACYVAMVLLVILADVGRGRKIRLPSRCSVD